ncbi:MAG: hypothetical protein ABIA76_00950, partial [Candidatus Diapherotrites archaeon]
MKEEFEFHQYNQINKRLLERFEEDKSISETNKAILRNYLNSLYVDALSIPRINKVFDQMIRLSHWYEKEWETA